MATELESPLYATVICEDHQWFIKFAYESQDKILLLSEDEAWNFDVERGSVLIIEYNATLNTARVIKRKSGNKKFVKV